MATAVKTGERLVKAVPELLIHCVRNDERCACSSGETMTPRAGSK